MDPVQTAASQVSQQGGGFIPFGGNPPQPPVPTPVAPVSMPDPLDAQGGMPPFHFDESDFVIPASTSPVPGATDISVPFGGTPAPLPVVAPVVDDNTTSITPPVSIEIAPVTTTDSTSPFAPRPDLDDEMTEPVSTVETQTGNEPFAASGFDLPSFDTTATTNEAKSDAGPFAMPMTESEVIPATESQTPKPTDGFDLPSFDSTTTPATTANDSSFELPSFDNTSSTTNTATETPELVMPSFDMPNSETNMPETVTTETASFDLPMTDTTTETAMSEIPSFDIIDSENPATTVSPAIETAAPIDMPMMESPIIETSSASNDDTPPMPTAPMTAADTTPTTEESSSPTNAFVSEETKEEVQGSEFVSDTTESPISSAYSTFVEKLTQLLDLTKTETISLVGHHTDDEHISYEFSHDETESVVIKHHDLTIDKSSATHTLSIDHSDGLSVYLDDELLADYSDTSVAVDEQISYYINDKLQKFTLMIESEYEKINKKTKEAEEKKKKLLADLRAF